MDALFLESDVLGDVSELASGAVYADDYSYEGGMYCMGTCEDTCDCSCSSGCTSCSGSCDGTNTDSRW